MKYGIVIGTHHKTGTVWMRNCFQAIADELGVPFKRLDQKNPDPKLAASMLEPDAGSKAVWFHHHSRFPRGLSPDHYRGVHVVRDPRDLVLSCANYHGWSSEPQLHEPRFDGRTYQEIVRELDFFDSVLFEMEHSGRENITGMVDFDEQGVFRTYRYEDLIEDREMVVFREMMVALGLEGAEVETALACVFEHSMFGKLGRVAHLSSHIQNARVAQWKSVFDRPMLDAFIQRFPDAPERIGYEASTVEALTPDPVFARRFRVRFHLRRDRLDRALSEAREGVDGDPSSAALQELLGDVLLRRGDHEDAEACFRRARELAPDRPGVITKIAACADAAGRLPEAIELAQEAAAREPESPKLRHELGRLLAEAGRDREAAAALEEAVALHEAQFEVQLLLGRVLVRLGRVNDAIVALEKAAELGPGSAGPHYALCEVLENRGETGRAQRHCRKALYFDPAVPRWIRLASSTLGRIGLPGQFLLLSLSRTLARSK